MHTLTPHLIQGAALAGTPTIFWLLAHLLRHIGTTHISRAQRHALADYIKAPAFENDLFSRQSPRLQARTLRFMRSRLMVDGALCCTALALAGIVAVWTFLIGTPRGMWVGPYLVVALLVMAWPFGDAWTRGRDTYDRARADSRRPSE